MKPLLFAAVFLIGSSSGLAHGYNSARVMGYEAKELFILLGDSGAGTITSIFGANAVTRAASGATCTRRIVGEVTCDMAVLTEESTLTQVSVGGESAEKFYRILRGLDDLRVEGVEPEGHASFQSLICARVDSEFTCTLLFNGRTS